MGMTTDWKGSTMMMSWKGPTMFGVPFVTDQDELRSKLSASNATGQSSYSAFLQLEKEFPGLLFACCEAADELENTFDVRAGLFMHMGEKGVQAQAQDTPEGYSSYWILVDEKNSWPTSSLE